MKKWRMAAFIILCLMTATVIFSKSEISAYAYTQEQIAAAKAWLEANGYSPTRAGAEQAYQDYLNGKFGTIDVPEETQSSATAETIATTEAILTETIEEIPVRETVILEETTKVVEKTVDETTETITGEMVDAEIETPTEGVPEEMESTSGIVSEESIVAIEENTIELESSTLSEEQKDGFIHVGRYDGIVVVIAVVLCGVMGFFTYKYIEKSKKDGE